MREARTEGMGKSHNKGIHNACSSRNIVRQVKARSGASMREMKMVCILSKNKERHNLEDLFLFRISL
jgi:hypothetical protein